MTILKIDRFKKNFTVVGNINLSKTWAILDVLLHNNF